MKLINILWKYFDLLKIFDLLTKSSIRNHYNFLKTTEFWNIEQIKELQLEKLQKIVVSAFDTVPYYHQVFENMHFNPHTEFISWETFEKIPILEKQMIRENQQNLVSSIKIPSLEIKTSGSTGTPITFLKDKNAQSMGEACYYHILSTYGYKLGDPIVKIWGRRPVNSVFNKIVQFCLNYIMNIHIFNSHMMDEKKMEAYFKKISKIRPKILYGYVSSIEDFARFIQTKKFEPPHIGAIVTTAEKLRPYQKSIIESAFNCPVYDQYGSSEVSGLAGMCPTSNGFHICSVHVIMEILKNEHPAKPGELGEIIITDLDNFQMPLIRYRLGDLSSFGEKCTCGRNTPLLKVIEGRTTDIIVGMNGNRVHGEYFSHLIESTDFMKKYLIEQFQVVQKSPSKLILNFKTKIDPIKIDFNDLLNYIKRDLGNMEVEFKVVPEIPKSNSGKMKFVISELSSS